MSEPQPRSTTLEPSGVVAGLGVAALILVPGVLVAALIFLGWTGVVLVLVLGVPVALFFFIDDIKAAVSWRRPTLELPAPTFELGSTTTAHYRRTSKRARDVERCIVDCTVSCRETVRYRRGTDTETERKTVYSRVFTASGYGTAQGLEAEVIIEIPTRLGAPSFQLPNNEVEWFIETQIRGPGLPKDDHRFEIEVVPVLNHAVPRRVQDT